MAEVIDRGSSGLPRCCRDRVLHRRGSRSALPIGSAKLDTPRRVHCWAAHGWTSSSISQHRSPHGLLDRGLVGADPFDVQVESLGSDFQREDGDRGGEARHGHRCHCMQPVSAHNGRDLRWRDFGLSPPPEVVVRREASRRVEQLRTVSAEADREQPAREFEEPILRLFACPVKERRAQHRRDIVAGLGIATSGAAAGGDGDNEQVFNTGMATGFKGLLPDVLPRSGGTKWDFTARVTVPPDTRGRYALAVLLTLRTRRTAPKKPRAGSWKMKLS